ncbi:MAG: DUF2459 domain-containing protein [Planctomycetes bacterium]|nr:DUF2459 domain-containing protein [Planctomycetota bacterium]
MLLPAVFAGAGGCTSTITPPAAVQDPVTVFLLREAMHSGVVLPSPTNGAYVEFGFGDWSWFALANDQWYNVFATVLWPTQGTLGRRPFPARTPDELRQYVTWAELQPLAIERAKATALWTRLHEQHAARQSEAVTRANLGWTFVPYDRSYWFPQTCADVAAEWFRELDCSVGWTPIRSSLNVAGQ